MLGTEENYVHDLMGNLEERGCVEDVSVKDNIKMLLKEIGRAGLICSEQGSVAACSEQCNEPLCSITCNKL